MRLFFALAVSATSLLLAASCGSYIPTGKMDEIIGNRTAAWITNTAASYEVYAGYGSDCSHPGAHFNFNAGDYPVYAAFDAIVAKIENCVIAGANDKYVITLAIAMKGSTPVLLEYGMEPNGGKLCSSADANEDYFDRSIDVEVGDRVVKGQRIASFGALGAGAHVHLNLKAHGALICPQIFPASFLSDTTKIAGGLAVTTCGSIPIASGTLCHALTDSEDPEKIFQ